MVEELQPGTYVVAVSGGVDSMALLHMLVQHPGLKLIVAHLDHGIRDNSHLDRRLVSDVAKSYGLPVVTHRVRLGAEASEAIARQARYEFLHKVREASGARAIVTAHHQDDLLETAVLNMLRGTGRNGLTSLKSGDTVVRPFLSIPKAEIYQHAQQHDLQWREDSTNQDTRYLRNHIRHNLMTRFGNEERQQLLDIILNMRELNDQIDALLINHLHVQLDGDKMERHWFIQLPHAVSREVMRAWLMRHKVNDLDNRTLERLVMAAKTYSSGQQTDIDGKHNLAVERKMLVMKHKTTVG